MRVYPPVHPIPRFHGTKGHSMGCPPVPFIEARVPYCPFHPMGPWDIRRDVHLSLSQMHVCPTVHPIPRSHGFMGHSMGCPPVPLTEVRVSYCPSHDPMGHSMGCPPVPLTEARVSYCPSHPTIPWDIPWDVHLSLSQKHVYPLVHPIPRSHGTTGHSMGCPPVPLTEVRVSYCPSHPTIQWDHGTFHGMSTCPSHRYVCIVLGDIHVPELSLHLDKMLISRSRYLLLIQTVLSVNGNLHDIVGTGRQLNAGLPRTWQFWGAAVFCLLHRLVIVVLI